MVTISTSTMFSLIPQLLSIAEKIESQEGPRFLIKVDEYDFIIEYSPKLKIVRGTIFDLDVDLAVHADTPKRAIKLLERSLWGCHSRPGYICLIDDTSDPLLWVSIRHYDRVANHLESSSFNLSTFSCTTTVL